MLYLSGLAFVISECIFSCIIDLPREFIEYLKSDGVVLPSRGERDSEGDGSDNDAEAVSLSYLNLFDIGVLPYGL